jgi:cytochrome c-type biogenesis protein CcmF
MIKFYDGNTFVGQLGHLAVIITFIAAIFSTYSYIKAHYAKSIEDSNQWKKLGRLFIYLETLGIVTIVATLYYILYNHLYQYKFAFKHSDNSLPIKYLFSCFWEGQEGSFILWLFWHAILSLFLIRSTKSWEAPVMLVIQFVQIFLAAFLLGIHFGDYMHIGSSPFVLLRNSDLGIGPVFEQADYLSKITDGRGLNKTLQDPWMVIHPPTLFFGFALCTVPMAYAIAAFLKKDYSGWIKPALPWTILAACMLGVGILMGAKWAYQSLSFGGYWAWDPVENASLVPWLIVIAGLHTMLIYKHTGYSLRASFLFIILTFVFIIYSTCLTRTGVLGDTSVHSFTGTGIVMQLWLFLLFMALPPILYLIYNYKKIPFIAKEESASSREFWMLIGGIVFFFSAMFVIIATSLPVFNKILGTNFALGERSQTIYNNVHVPVVIVIAIILGYTQYLKYKSTSNAFILKKQLVPIAISIILGVAFLWVQPIQYNKEGDIYKILIAAAVIASIYGLIINVFYWIDIVKNKVINWGSALSHIGFTLMLVGFLISSANQKILSMNKPMFNIFGNDKTNDPRENLNLIKNVPTKMGKYKVTYLSDTADAISKDRQYYNVEFIDTTNNNKFYLKPNAFLNVEMNGKKGIQPNPDYKNFYNNDLFLYITSLIDPDKKSEPPKFETKPMKTGDTMYLMNGYIALNNQKFVGQKFDSTNINGSIEATLSFTNMSGKKYEVTPRYIIKNNVPTSTIDSIPQEKLMFKIEGAADSGALKIAIKDSNPFTDYITIKVLEFPNINFIWIGMCIMSLGFMIAMYKRIKEIKH